MLRDYQKEISNEAAKLLQWMGIAYLSMEVRTGKTLTALDAAGSYGAKSVLFVTKKKAISSIEADITKLQPSFEIVVTNYEQLHNIIFSPDLVILDEAHCLGQYPIPSERTKLLRKICFGLPILYLSGTPTPESYSQLFHQLWVSSRSPWKEYTSFYSWAKDYVNVKKKYLYNREINDYSEAIKDKVDNDTKHLFISYSQAEAGFDCPVIEEFVLLKMAPGTYWLADKLRKDKVFIGKNGEEILADTAVKLMSKLHQVYSGTVIAEDKIAITFDDTKAKYIANRWGNNKIAIFYKFTAEYAMLLFAFPGRLTSDPDEFNKSTNKIFACQIQSGREGINLSTAEYIIMYNIDFSALSYWQSRARMQVKDRTTPAIIYWVFSEGGIETKIYQAVSNKKDYTLSYFKKDERITTTGTDKEEDGGEGVDGGKDTAMLNERVA